MFPQTTIATLIHNDHLKTLESLQSLEALLRRQSDRRPPDLASGPGRAALEAVVAALATDIQCHFTFEETYLFPLLQSVGEYGITSILREEHDAIRPLAQTISDTAVAALESGSFADAVWRDFHAQGMELCEREIFHIQKEEMGLLGALGTFVDAEMDAQLSSLYQTQVTQG